MEGEYLSYQCSYKNLGTLFRTRVVAFFGNTSVPVVQVAECRLTHLSVRHGAALALEINALS